MIYFKSFSLYLENTLSSWTFYTNLNIKEAYQGKYFQISAVFRTNTKLKFANWKKEKKKDVFEHFIW